MKNFEEEKTNTTVWLSSFFGAFRFTWFQLKNILSSRRRRLCALHTTQHMHVAYVHLYLCVWVSVSFPHTRHLKKWTTCVSSHLWLMCVRVVFRLCTKSILTTNRNKLKTKTLTLTRTVAHEMNRKNKTPNEQFCVWFIFRYTHIVMFDDLADDHQINAPKIHVNRYKQSGAHFTPKQSARMLKSDTHQSM